ncbi:unnamed protein product, partial [Mesorhabditis spiculigera]
MQRLLSTLFFSNICWILRAGEFRTPSLYEISGYKDPVLNEVFREHQIELRQKAEPGEAPLLSNTPPPLAPRNPNYRGEVPIQRPSNGFEQAYNRPAHGQIGTDDGLTDLAAAGGRLAYGGAQQFFQGAGQVGQAFGIPNGGSNTFIDSAARFFG